MKRVIVTGGNGFIGKHLVKKLLSSKLHSVAIIAKTPNNNLNYFEDIKLPNDLPLTFHTVDIRDRKAIPDIFREERADTCIHLAAKTSVADSIKNPDETMDINVNGTLNVLEACYNSHVSNFIFTSSAAVYGKVSELPIAEYHTLRPLSPYGKSKMLAEQHIFSYNKSKKIQNAILLRIFNVYGTGQANETDVITRFISRLSKGLPPVIYGAGKHTRDFISVDDVVDGILLSITLMEELENNIDNDLSSPLVFNMGTGRPTSTNELAQKMIQIFGLDLQPIYEEGRDDKRVILHSYADMTKSKEILHFVAKKRIEIGLREIIEPLLMKKMNP